MEDGKREDLDGITTVTLVHVISKKKQWTWTWSWYSDHCWFFFKHYGV